MSTIKKFLGHIKFNRVNQIQSSKSRLIFLIKLIEYIEFIKFRVGAYALLRIKVNFRFYSGGSHNISFASLTAYKS
jgi:hypothetical protein